MTAVNIYKDGYPNTVRGSINVISAETSTVEALSLRLERFRTVWLPRILETVTNHPEYRVIGGIIDDVPLHVYQKKWDLLFEEIKKDHEELGWFNPFLSRLVYNAITLLPATIWSKYIQKLVLFTYRDEDDKCNVINFYKEISTWRWRLPFISNLKPYHKVFEDIKYESDDFYRLHLYLNSSREFQKAYLEFIEEARQHLFDLEKLMIVDPIHFTKTEDDLTAYVDQGYLYFVLAMFIPDYRSLEKISKARNINLDEYPKVIYPNFEINVTETPSDLVNILKTSRNLVKLIRARTAIMELPHREFQTLISDEETKRQIEENFFKWAGINFYDPGEYEMNFDEDLGIIQKSVEDRLNNPIETANSEPYARWIRTIKGEVYVNRVEEDEAEEVKEEEGFTETEDVVEETPTTETDKVDGLFNPPDTIEVPKIDASEALDILLASGDKDLLQRAIDLMTNKLSKVRYDEDQSTLKSKATKVDSVIWTSIGDASLYAKLRTLSTTGYLPDAFDKKMVHNSAVIEWVKQQCDEIIESKVSAMSLQHAVDIPQHAQLGRHHEVIKEDKSSDVENVTNEVANEVDNRVVHEVVRETVDEMDTKEEVTDVGTEE